jgi:hypothetical protein
LWKNKEDSCIGAGDELEQLVLSEASWGSVALRWKHENIVFGVTHIDSYKDTSVSRYQTPATSCRQGFKEFFLSKTAMKEKHRRLSLILLQGEGLTIY